MSMLSLVFTLLFQSIVFYNEKQIFLLKKLIMLLCTGKLNTKYTVNCVIKSTLIYEIKNVCHLLS